MDKLNFKLYNLNILQESKTAWENDEIKNPRLSLKGIESIDLTIDEAEELIIDNIRRSFQDLRDVMAINQFSDAKLIMPAFQMCSDDKLDVVDFGFNIINPNTQNESIDYPTDEYVDDESLSDWNHPSEMWEEFAQMMEEELEEELEDPIGSYTNPVDLDGEIIDEDIELEEEEDQSESELDFIKKSINGDI